MRCIRMYSIIRYLFQKIFCALKINVLSNIISFELFQMINNLKNIQFYFRTPRSVSVSKHSYQLEKLITPYRKRLCSVRFGAGLIC